MQNRPKKQSKKSQSSQKPIKSPYIFNESMKTVTLDIKDRLFTANFLNDFKGSLTDTALVLEDLKKIAILDDEKKEINLRAEDKLVLWDADKAKDKEMELHNETVTAVLAKIEEKDKAGEVTFADVDALVALKKKLS